MTAAGDLEGCVAIIISDAIGGAVSEADEAFRSLAMTMDFWGIGRGRKVCVLTAPQAFETSEPDADKRGLGMTGQFQAIEAKGIKVTANLGRWHLTRIETDTAGTPLWQGSDRRQATQSHFLNP